MGLPTSASHPNLRPPELGLSMHVYISRTLAFTLVAVTFTFSTAFVTVKANG